MKERRKQPSLEEETELVTGIINKIGPHFEKVGGDIQGMVLSQLVALWLAGHYIDENPTKSVFYRDGVLQHFIGQVRHALPRYVRTIEAIRKTTGHA